MLPPLESALAVSSTPVCVSTWEPCCSKGSAVASPITSSTIIVANRVQPWAREPTITPNV